MACFLLYFFDDDLDLALEELSGAHVERLHRPEELVAVHGLFAGRLVGIDALDEKDALGVGLLRIHGRVHELPHIVLLLVEGGRLGLGVAALLLLRLDLLFFLLHLLLPLRLLGLEQGDRIQEVGRGVEQRLGLKDVSVATGFIPNLEK